MNVVTITNSNRRPNRTVRLRHCSHCKEQGHNINSCNKAVQDGMIIHNQLINIIEEGNLEYPNSIYIDIAVFLSYLRLPQLKLLAIIHKNLNIFAFQLYQIDLININQSNYNNKRDLILVLRYYYQVICETNYFGTIWGLLERFQFPNEEMKINIETRVLIENNNNNVNNNNFECPICIEIQIDEKRITTNCNHDICNSCFDKYLDSLKGNTPTCCLCRTKITNVLFKKNEYCNIIKNKYLI
jgi:hypothetical protein